MEKGISYLNKTYSEIKAALIEKAKKYYPDLAANYDDASIMSWLMDICADTSDNLAYHIDRIFQETNINSAQEKSSLYDLARNNGFRIPGPKGAMAEVAISCTLPVDGNNPNWKYAPIVKTGTKLASSTQQFEILTDVDFNKQFNEDGYSDRTITPNYNSNGQIVSYKVTKLAVAVAGDSRVYRQAIYAKDVKPFMEILIPLENVMNVESVVMVPGTSIQTTPPYGAFYSESETVCAENKKYTRFFEVENLAQIDRWRTKQENGTSVRYEYKYNDDGKTYPVFSISKGEWVPVEHKFTTEYTDKGYLKVIFGSGGGDVVDGSQLSGASGFAKYQIEKMMNNDNMGVLPDPDSTIFILYRVGGGKASNVAKGAINRIATLNIEMNSEGTNATLSSSVRSSIEVTNTTPSVSGKDMPSNEELRYMIKYHNAAQNRCVTVKDYEDRILLLPPKYGTPFRVGVMEENNKVMIYLLGLDYQGKLDTLLPVTLINNIKEWLSGYRMINDYVEIKSGRIINLAFDVDIIMDKNYNKSDVVRMVINKVKDYMDINKHRMGEEIYIGDLEKEISKVDGVINMISLRVYNVHGPSEKYSTTHIGQEITTIDTTCDVNEAIDYLGDTDRDLVDLNATDGILYNDGDQMMEIKYPETDIVVRVKSR